jgi:hypothetical protein
VKPKVVIDKHLDPEAIGEALGLFAMSAATHEPTSKYRGNHPDDEDFYSVLQLGWEHEVAVLSRDGAMIDKAIAFRQDLPIIGRETCLRGVIILPLLKEDQVTVLRRFIAGEIEIIPSRSGGPVPASIHDLENYNLGLDLRKSRPKLIELCECED